MNSEWTPQLTKTARCKPGATSRQRVEAFGTPRSKGFAIFRKGTPAPLLNATKPDKHWQTPRKRQQSSDQATDRRTRNEQAKSAKTVSL